MVRVAVIGAGIMGTCSAYQIKDAFPNFDVTMIAEKFSPNNTSDGAAGFWRAAKVAGTPLELIKKWSEGTQRYAYDLLKTTDAPLMGLSICHGYLVSSKPLTRSDWEQQSPNCHILSESELKQFPAKIKSGCSYSSIVIESAKFIPYMTKQFANKGGKILKQRVTDINKLFESYDLVINCSGLAAGELVNDTEVYPIRGQTIRVKAPWIKEFIFHIDVDENGRCVYMFPNQDYVVLGGTKQENNSNTEATVEEHDWIMKYTQEFIPSLKHAEFICDWVGLRPARSRIRLEKEVVCLDQGGNDGDIKNGIIIHNYGHGANGITLSWGCCEDVVELVRDCCKDIDISLQAKL